MLCSEQASKEPDLLVTGPKDQSALGCYHRTPQAGAACMGLLSHSIPGWTHLLRAAITEQPRLGSLSNRCDFRCWRLEIQSTVQAGSGGHSKKVYEKYGGEVVEKDGVVLRWPPVLSLMLLFLTSPDPNRL